MVLPSLILQKPSRQSKAKDHAHCIQRRLQFWGDGEMDKLIEEVRAIQSHLPPASHHDNKQTKSTARRFAELMAEGKIRAATRLLDNGDDDAGVPLGPNDVIETPEGSCTVREALIKKHPSAQPCEPSTILPPTNEALPFHLVLFESINATAIHTAALKTKESHGPSGLDAAACMAPHVLLVQRAIKGTMRSSRKSCWKTCQWSSGSSSCPSSHS